MGKHKKRYPCQNPVDVGRYNIPKHEQYPQKIQSLYCCDVQRYLSNLKRDACLLERLKPVAKNNWRDSICAPRCPDTFEKSHRFPNRRWCWEDRISEWMAAMPPDEMG